MAAFSPLGLKATAPFGIARAVGDFGGGGMEKPLRALGKLDFCHRQVGEIPKPSKPDRGWPRPPESQPNLGLQIQINGVAQKAARAAHQLSEDWNTVAASWPRAPMTQKPC